MKADLLVPAPDQKTAFRRDKLRFVPSAAGCYALTTFLNDVVYVGLATDLRRRFDQHLDSPEKRAATSIGRPIFFSWLLTSDLNRVERTWMNIHIQQEGELPPLNKTYSPTVI
jgi:hypothetical protein